ncbi:DUF5753 domain-containing protein [Actinomadura xylanilytica]|uniref:DUF5753 domain-containing protein n=1 Tax=Actinomadura xylanilytica TaxID=887459 RepID=UPI00255A91D1|nr:DUF5753 domain-containing protein [Actinomadura xylanilytica]MDL4770909.1 DUF5753 domain-containing protein [Actinomadura xylanilytica]
MPEASPSTVRLRKIGRTLRTIREESDHTLKTAGRLRERSSSSLSLIENGNQPLRLRDLAFILDRYAVPTDLRAALLTLAEQEHQSGWWDTFKDVVTHGGRDRATLEDCASLIVSTETTFIPGLLQTEEYASAVIRGIRTSHSPSTLNRYVEFRLARQGILRRAEPATFNVIIDEAALRRVRGGRHVMRAQLRRLLNDSEQDHVSIHVSPLTAEAGPDYAGEFQLTDIGSPPILSVVRADHLTSQWTEEDDAATTQYREVFEQIRSSTLPESASQDLIHRIVSEL